ncbi:MFS transporter [Bradyrhizobium sp. DOA9]|uniref:MFS transporter n=1 Tax=Bradyrhizobium sp. DOA9 TaxID=1126627 RepID=UPI0005AA7B69|nr:MFS transporter [Bradyrhizobium sp. DOA9]
MMKSQQLSSNSVYAKVAWRILPILFVVQLIGIVDRFNVGFAQLQMSKELGLSNAAYGFGAGLFFIGYFVFEIPSNMILARVGAKAWFTRILVTWGIATVAMAFVTNETWFYVLRFLVGAAEAGFAPGTQLYFSRWFPNGYRGRVNGWFLMSIPLAGMLNGPISGNILGHLSGFAGLSGWQWLFLIEGVVTIALAPLLFVILPNEPKNAGWLGKDERLIVEEGVETSRRLAHTHAIGDMLRSPRTLLMAAVYFLLLLGNYGIAFWMPQIIKGSGIADPVAIGWLAAVPSLCAFVAMPLFSRLSDAGGRKWYLVVGGLTAAIGLVITSLNSTNTTLAIVGLALTASGVLGCIPVFWAYAARVYFGPAAVVGFALINSVGNLAGFVAPSYIGIVADATGSPVNGVHAIAIGQIVAILLIAAFFDKADSQPRLEPQRL